MHSYALLTFAHLLCCRGSDQHTKEKHLNQNDLGANSCLLMVPAHESLPVHYKAIASDAPQGKHIQYALPPLSRVSYRVLLAYVSHVLLMSLPRLCRR